MITLREIDWKLVKNTVHQHRTAVRLANNGMGSRGSCTRRSYQANRPRVSTAIINNPDTSGACQGKPWPISVMPSSSVVRPRINNRVPK
ncbi:hypothetical protein D3C81_1544700 [compost metagenome]